jgi:hypothetical protein
MNKINSFFKLSLLTAFLLVMGSCATIPKESYQINEAISERLEQHRKAQQLLLNELMAMKREKVTVYVKETYLPTLVKNLKSVLSENNMDTALTSDMIYGLLEKTSEKQLELNQALEKLRVSLSTAIEEEYRFTIFANDRVSSFIRSAAEVEESRNSAINQLSKEGGLPINSEELSTTIDDYILKGGEYSEKMEKLKSKIEDKLKTY